MAAAAVTVTVTVVRTLLGVLGGLMVAVLVYTIATDGLPFRMELLTRWMAALLIDFYINIAVIGTWVVYKESSWPIMAVVWVVLLICLGSVTTCGYIILQLVNLTPEESSKDPFYFVLARHHKRSDVTEHSKGVSVITARVIFALLGCLMLATLLYTIIVDGSPFRSELYTPWVVATLIDFYINVVAISLWVAYKESSWMHAVLWIFFLICFGSITTCVYIVRQLFALSSDHPMFLILFRNNHSDVTEHSKGVSVITARVIFALLGCLMLATLLYTIIVDGSPFRSELYTPWVVATLIDFYINVVAISLWVAYKESSWMHAVLWIFFLICFGSITTCVYIVRQLFALSSDHPMFLILFRNNHRDLKSSDPPLIVGANE